MAAYPYQPYNVQSAYGNMYGGIQPTQYQPTYTQPVAQVQQQPVDNLIRVTGLDGAKAYQMPPNSVVPLFDANNDIMYIKSTDGAGFPSIRAFSFAPIEAAVQEPNQGDYVQRSEFEELAAQVRGLLGGEQSVRKQPAVTGTKSRKQSDPSD